ncbi:MAG: hypothetical protein ACRD1K_05310 [Acidimicrobiales bacterium]
MATRSPVKPGVATARASTSRPLGPAAPAMVAATDGRVGSERSTTFTGIVGHGGEVLCATVLWLAKLMVLSGT